MRPLLRYVTERLAPDDVVVAPDDEVAGVLAALGHRAVRSLAVADRHADVVVLSPADLGRAGDRAENLVAEAGRVLRPGGLLVAGARNRLHGALTGAAAPGVRHFTAAELARTLGARGFSIEVLASPGAAALVAGRSGAELPHDPERDREPGLLDAGPLTVAVARAPVSSEGRSATFFASLPRKVVAAAVVCRDGDGRLLVVHDSFRRHWTIPGGVVDADEGPRSAAVRETWEEAGVRVRAGALLGTFHATWPDRLTFVFAATPVGWGTPQPSPVHTHEIDAACWLPLDEALDRLVSYVREQVDRSLEHPGGLWP